MKQKTRQSQGLKRVSCTALNNIRHLNGGGGNRIVACNPYHRLLYIFSIFKIPENVPADLLDAIGFYRTAIDVNVRFWHKADVHIN